MFLIYLFNIDSFFNVTIIFFKIILKFSAHRVVHISTIIIPRIFLEFYRIHFTSNRCFLDI